jgi:hypothetical protein
MSIGINIGLPSSATGTVGIPKGEKLKEIDTPQKPGLANFGRLTLTTNPEASQYSLQSNNRTEVIGDTPPIDANVNISCIGADLTTDLTLLRSRDINVINPDLDPTHKVGANFHIRSVNPFDVKISRKYIDQVETQMLHLEITGLEKVNDLYAQFEALKDVEILLQSLQITCTNGTYVPGSPGSEFVDEQANAVLFDNGPLRVIRKAIELVNVKLGPPFTEEIHKVIVGLPARTPVEIQLSRKQPPIPLVMDIPVQ